VAGGKIGDIQTLSKSLVTTLGTRVFRIDLSAEHEAIIEGKAYSYSLAHLGDDRYSLLVDGKCFQLVASSNQNDAQSDLEVLVSLNGKQLVALVDDARTYQLRSLFAKTGGKQADQTVKAPMPGLISRLEVATGDAVAPGQGLLVLEAMKMENEIRATSGGTVTKVFVQRGKVVEKGEPLLTIAGK
jgi:pyruvate carboxylase subunit B